MFHEHFPFPSEHVVTWFQKIVFNMPRYSEEDFSRFMTAVSRQIKTLGLKQVRRFLEENIPT